MILLSVGRIDIGRKFVGFDRSLHSNKALTLKHFNTSVNLPQLLDGFKKFVTELQIVFAPYFNSLALINPAQ